MLLGLQLMLYVYFGVGLHVLRYNLNSQAHLSLCYRPTFSQAASLLDALDPSQTRTYVIELL